MKQMFIPQNENQIYSIIDQESIFLLCGIRVEYNKRLGNPFRPDKHQTSVSFYNWTNLRGQSIIYMNDFADKEYRSLTAFRLYVKVRQIEHYPFSQQYLKLVKEIETNITIKPFAYSYETYRGKEIVLYQIKEKEHPHHKQYLLEHGIDLDLIPEEKKYIKFIDHVIKYYPESNTPTRTVFHTGRNFPIFGYIFPSQSIKFYVPSTKAFSKMMFGNASKEDVYGSWDYDPKVPTVITKSGKDRLTILTTLKKMNYQHKINILAPNGEAMIPQLFNIHEMISDPKSTLVWFDNDDAGKTALNLYDANFGFKTYHNDTDEPKDPSDFYKQLGEKAFIERLSYVLSLNLNLHLDEN